MWLSHQDGNAITGPPEGGVGDLALLEIEEADLLIHHGQFEGIFTPDQKRQIAERLTDTTVGIVGESMRELTTVVIDETKSGDWAIGGRCLTTQDVLAVASGAAGGSS